MSKKLQCYIVSDLMPLYLEDILSEETKADIDMHLRECEDCKKRMDAMNMPIDVPLATVELKSDPFKKIKFYQKMLTILGAVIAFILGACCPIARLGIGVLVRGGITEYQLLRLKNLWDVLLLECLGIGFVVCIVYLLLVFLIKRKISR